MTMCRWAKVSRSGYYDWRNRTPSATTRWRAEMTSLVRFVFTDSQGTYGYRRVHAALCRLGHPRQIPKRSARSCVPKASCLANPNRNGVAPPSQTLLGPHYQTSSGKTSPPSGPQPHSLVISIVIDTWEGRAVPSQGAGLFLNERGRIRHG